MTRAPASPVKVDVSSSAAILGTLIATCIENAIFYAGWSAAGGLYQRTLQHRSRHENTFESRLSVQLGQDFNVGQAQLAGDQAGEQGVAESGEGLGLLLVRNEAGEQR